MDESLKALLLLNNSGYSNAAAWKKFVASHLPSELWSLPYEQLSELRISKPAHIRLTHGYNAAWAEREYDECSKKGISLITCMDKAYPTELNDLAEPPVLLYWHGAAKGLPAVNVSVIGTRKASNYGKKTAQTIGERCAELDIGLVSGGAGGIDGFAHAGSCRNGGATYVVMGTGIDQCYPSSHSRLFEEIRAKGALISEYPLHTRGEPWRFPRRNRIVAALGKKTVVVEAPKKSGAMITARCALEMGREVWAVPGRIDEEIAAGVNMLIYDGAYPFIGMDVFFSSFSGQGSLFAIGASLEKTQEIVENLSENEKLIIKKLKLHGERTVDNISLEVKMSAAEVMKIMVILSAKGLIYLSGPGRFSAKN